MGHLVSSIKMDWLPCSASFSLATMCAARAGRKRYSAQEREDWLRHVAEEARGMHGRLTSVRKLLLPHGAPSRASYYQWRGVSKIAKAPVRRMGRRPRLNEAEKDVLAGRVLWRVHHLG